jgi:hypothetical protein
MATEVTTKLPLHPLDETSVPYRAVALLFQLWELTIPVHGLPQLPRPILPMVLHALTGEDAALVFAAERGGPQFESLYFRRVWPSATSAKALAAAITYSKPLHVEILFRQCIDVNQPFGGRTPLWLAAEAGNAEVMRHILLRFPAIGADVLTTAVTREHTECAELLLEAGALPLREHAATALGRRNERLLRLLLSYGVAIDATLLKAALDGAAVTFLPIMAQGLTTNTTPLIMAVQAREGQLVRTLLDTFSDAQLQINYVAPGSNVTALWLAMQWEHCGGEGARGAGSDSTSASRAQSAAGQKHSNPARDCQLAFWGVAAGCAPYSRAHRRQLTADYLYLF